MTPQAFDNFYSHMVLNRFSLARRMLEDRGLTPMQATAVLADCVFKLPPSYCERVEPHAKCRRVVASALPQ